MDLNRTIVFFAGPPGAGKGTQSILLEEACNFKHLETSEVIESVFRDNPDDPEIQKIKSSWLKGDLVPSDLVASWMLDSIRKSLEVGNVVMSGSPRRIEEFMLEVPEIEKYVRKDRIIIFHMPITKEDSVLRNSGRRICTAHRHPIPGYGDYVNMTKCPRDGSDLVRRELDVEEVIKDRYDVYLRETYPVLEYFKSHGYSVVDLPKDSIDNIHRKVLDYLKDVCTT